MSDAAATAPSGPAAPPAPPREAKLDDIMLAMDVVDTLRHQDALVARELDADARQAELIDRLRAIYKSQGLEVTDRILIEGVRALQEARFVYTPPPPGLARTLATLWVQRDAWARKALATILVVAIGWGAWQYFFVGAAERQAERARIELTQTLPSELDRLHKAALAEARVAEARDRANAALADGRLALERKDPEAARKAIGDLNGLLDRLRQEYALRIVSRTGEQSGIWRIPPNRPTGRNYYLIVEPVTPSGTLVKLPITSEEDQKTSTVDRFGIRVSQDVYDAVRRDKADDGIIQRAVIGQKTRGHLEPAYTLPVLGGHITEGW